MAYIIEITHPRGGFSRAEVVVGIQDRERVRKYWTARGYRVHSKYVEV